MTTEQNKQVVLRWREERDKGNWNIIDELHAPDYVGHIAGVPGPVRGREALKQLFVGYSAAFEVHATPESDFLIAEGEMVINREAFRLKHRGAFQGIPPTGKEATVTSTDIYRIVDGKIVEQWTEGDMLSLMQQLGVLSMPGHGAPSSSETNKAIIRRFCDEVLSEHWLDRADELVTRDYVDHAPLPGQTPGLEGAKQKWATYFAAFPDLHVTMDELAAEGDAVVVRWMAEGTHQGNLLGIAPTGKPVHFSGISICRVRDGRMFEQWEESDRLSLAQQLGAIPTPAVPTPAQTG
jgi:predicted ester cyclase